MSDNKEFSQKDLMDFAVHFKYGDDKTITSALENFKKSKQISKEWEIVSCLSKNAQYPHPYDPKICLGANIAADLCTIYSVRRLSDNEIFEVGEQVNYGIIGAFYLSYDRMHVHFTSDGGATLASIEKVKSKEVLFTTADNVLNHVGDIYYKVYCDFTYCQYVSTKNGNYPKDYTDTCFSTKEKVDEYVLQNKPVMVSHKELLETMATTGNGILNGIKQLFKSKINL
jgi:hypothetical protein